MSNEIKRNKLQNWLVEHEFCQQMRPSVDKETRETAPIDFSGEPASCEGQIRVWPAVNPAEPVYGLLMRGSYGLWRVFQFSPLALPAVAEELRVREEGPVWVIQGWNTRTGPTTMVESSWCVGKVEEEVPFRVNSWWVTMGNEESFPEMLSTYIDPPLRNPLDPHHGYREEEQQRVDRCLGESLPADDSCAPKLDIAAEPEAEYGDSSEEPD